MSIARGPALVSTDYTGHVSPGSAAARRDVGGASIVKVSVGPMDNNAYLIRCANTGHTVLIDAANEPTRLLALLETLDWALAAIVTTHQHPDHWQALAHVAHSTGVLTYAHPLDASALPINPDRLLDDGDQLPVGNLSLTAIHLRGHTRGSISLALTDDDGGQHLFTGDSLFPGGVGRTQSPADFATLFDDVSRKLFARYPDDATVYPGHGDDTTLGTERPHLPEWQRRGW